jgi:hypothetical protein
MTNVADETIAKPQAAKILFGEELPVFCEACGYSLHGLPRIRCGHCEVLHFHCPECGHHQPINTLRPAVQRVLGRLRAWALGFSVFFRMNYFGWLLVAWFVMGLEWSNALKFGYFGSYYEIVFSFLGFGIPFGGVSRMMLLRWRRGYIVALILAAVTTTSVWLGIWYWAHEQKDSIGWGSRLLFLQLTFCSVALGALIGWPVWAAMTMLFLPKRTAKRLLDWQRSLSDPSFFARD